MSSATPRRTVAVLCIKFETSDPSFAGRRGRRPLPRIYNLKHQIVRLREEQAPPTTRWLFHISNLKHCIHLSAVHLLHRCNDQKFLLINF